MLQAKLKESLNQAIRSKYDLKKNILRVVLGEVELAEARSKKGDTLPDDQIVKIIQKMVASNTETIAVDTNKDRVATLMMENIILEEYLPKQLTPAEIDDFLQGKSLTAHIGKATGEAMKMIKEAGLSAKGNDVKEAVGRFIERYCS